MIHLEISSQPLRILIKHEPSRAWLLQRWFALTKDHFECCERGETKVYKLTYAELIQAVKAFKKEEA